MLWSQCSSHFGYSVLRAIPKRTDNYIFNSAFLYNTSSKQTRFARFFLKMCITCVFIICLIWKISSHFARGVQIYGQNFFLFLKRTTFFSATFSIKKKQKKHFFRGRDNWFTFFLFFAISFKKYLVYVVAFVWRE